MIRVVWIFPACFHTEGRPDLLSSDDIPAREKICYSFY